MANEKLSKDLQFLEEKIAELTKNNQELQKELEERKMEKDGLADPKKYFFQLFNLMADPVVIVNSKGKFLYISDKVVELTGFKRDELIGKNFVAVKICTAKSKVILLANLAKRMMGMKIAPYEVDIITKDGSKIPYEVNAAKIKYLGQAADMVIFRDIAARRKAQKELIESEEKFRTIFESSSDAIMTLEPPTWGFTSCNPSAIKMFNCKDEAEFTSLGPWSVSPETQPDGQTSAEKAKKMIMKAMEEGSNFFDWTHKRLNGKDFPATVLLTKVRLEEKEFLQATVRDITAQKQAENLKLLNIKLKQEKEEIERINMLKGDFLTNMSHELRTPLNSVIALSRVLLNQASNKLIREEVNYLEVIERNGKILLHLINDILDITKIESGEVMAIPKPFSINSTIKLVKENLQPLIGDKKISLNLDLPDELPKLDSDEDKIYHILQNLVSNAVKFTNKGNVTISATCDSQRISIAVTDTGIGIKKDDISHLFEKFKQVDDSFTKRFEGTGVGLAIVHEYLKMLDGDIDVQSELGKGSTFTVSFPITWQKTKPIQKSGFKPKEVIAGRRTILVVDDEPFAVQFISDILEKEQYNIIAATSGIEALELAEKFMPYAITLDIIMPEIDGWEILQKLKRNPKTTNIPVIVVTKSKDKHTGFALGAVGYVSKPVIKDTLISEIHKINHHPHSVMIVDDDEFDRKTMTGIIKSENISVIVATGGKECLDLLKKSLPDVLILDLLMPEIDGFQVIKKIRKEPKTINLPVIIVTAKDLTDQDKMMLNGNVASILSKNKSSLATLSGEIKRVLTEIDRQQREEYNKDEKADKPIENLSSVLVVEDNSDNMITLKAILKNRYNIIEAIDGEIGLEKAKSYLPDLILLDIALPKMDGFAVIKHLKKEKNTKKIPVVALTAMAMKDDRNKILKSGFDDYVAKPIDPIGLLEVIKSKIKEK